MWRRPSLPSHPEQPNNKHKGTKAQICFCRCRPLQFPRSTMLQAPLPRAGWMTGEELPQTAQSRRATFPFLSFPPRAEGCALPRANGDPDNAYAVAMGASDVLHASRKVMADTVSATKAAQFPHHSFFEKQSNEADERTTMTSFLGGSADPLAVYADPPGWPSRGRQDGPACDARSCQSLLATKDVAKTSETPTTDLLAHKYHCATRRN